MLGQMILTSPCANRSTSAGLPLSQPSRFTWGSSGLELDACVWPIRASRARRPLRSLRAKRKALTWTSPRCWCSMPSAAILSRR